ncbi:MAG: spermidine/putrescine ABC transporter substrate-binding protein, partial [Gaiellaceae bacterium]
MTDVLSRRQLLRRAAAGGAFLTVPGVLAACGGTTKKAASTTVNKTLAKTLRFSNWTYYMDTNNKKHSHPSLQDFDKKFGTHVQYTEDINDNASYFGKI